MSAIQWSIARNRALKPGDVMALKQPIGLFGRVFAAVAALLGGLGVWELLVNPLVFSRLPPFGLLQLPLLILGCISVLVFTCGLAFFLLAAQEQLVLVKETKSLEDRLVLRIPFSATRTFQLHDISRLWVERSTFHQQRESWTVNISLQGKRHPTMLHSLDSQAEAMQLAEDLRRLIENEMGKKLPS